MAGRDWRTFAAKDCPDIAKAVHLATIVADPVDPVAPLAHPLAQGMLQGRAQTGALTFPVGHGAAGRTSRPTTSPC